jgi:hypothetical protein
MPVDIFNIPQLNPTKFYQLSDVFSLANSGHSYKIFNPNINQKHIDLDFMARNIPSYFEKTQYFQPYQTGDVLSAQWTGVPAYTSPFLYTYRVHIAKCTGEIIKTVICSNRTPVLSTGAQIWYYNVPLWDVPEGKYVVLIEKINNSVSPQFIVISEGIDIKHHHPDTVQIQYTHNKNAYGMFFQDFQMFTLRIHAHLDLMPEAEINVYDDQTKNLTLLSGTPYRNWKLTIATNGKDIPPYLADIINRATLCDALYINDIRMTRTEGSKIEIDTVEKRPLMEVSLEFREYNNDVDLVVPEFPYVYMMDAPTSEYFYIHDITVGTSTPFQVRTYFHGVKNFIDYLNTVYINTMQFKFVLFGLNGQNQIVLQTSDQSTYTIFSTGFASILCLQGWLYMRVNVSTSAGGSISLSSSFTSQYAVFWRGRQTAPTIGSASSITLTHGYLQNQYDTFLFVDDAEGIDLTGMTANVDIIGGQLPRSTNVFYANGIGVKSMSRNMFDRINNQTLVDLALSGNNFSSAEINKILSYLWESVSALDSGTSIDLSGQIPAAPPLASGGVQTFINTINNIAVITTD